MHARWTGLGPAFCAFLLSLLTLGCGREPGQILAHWTLEVPGEQPRSVDLPARLESVLGDRVLRYRLKAAVPIDPSLAGHDVELVLPYLAAPVTLRVEGEEAYLAGDARPGATYGGCGPRRWLLPSSATSGASPVHLELEVTHHWTPSARIDSVPELVAGGSTSPAAERNRLLNVWGAWFGLVALSQVGLTFLAVYFWDRRRRAYLWFAIQALTASYYPAYVAGLPSLLGWRVENVLLAQSLAVAPIVSVYFTHAFFGLARPGRAWVVLMVVALVSPLVVAVDSYVGHPGFLVISYSAVIVVVCVLSTVVYQVATGIRLLGQFADRRIVVFFLGSWLALGLSSWVDLLAWGGGPDVLRGGRPAGVGLGLFGLFQSMLLSRSHSRSLVESDRLNERLRRQVQALESRQAEIETLNEELRRQIGRRTEDILSALAEGDRMGEVELHPGDIVEGRYRVIRTLGSGGMGSVYEVERPSDGRRLALKVTQELRGRALARLAREAHVATGVNHPNVVSVVDTDVAQGGYAFLVMELVEGRSLAECGKDHEVRWRLDVLLQVVRGLRALHDEGIIHRDLKPSNVLVSDEASASPSVKITDFGISRWLEDEPRDGATTRSHAKAEDPTVKTRADTATPTTGASRSGSLRDPRSSRQLTRTGQVSGTPGYVAPELAGGTAHLSRAVDVFSFGVVAYTLLAGVPPYVEPPFLVRLDGRDVARPTPIASLCPVLSGELARALDGCLSITPDTRPEVGVLVTLFESELALEASRDRGPPDDSRPHDEAAPMRERISSRGGLGPRS
jgi:serine/threonine-protein kinase